MKNKAELKSWFEDDKLYVGEYVKHKINQLDEPEVLSLEWIVDNVSFIQAGRGYVLGSKLQNLLVPEQEITFEQAHEKLREESVLSEKSFDYYRNCINDGVEIDEPGNLLVPKQEGITHKQVEKYLLDKNIRVIDIDVYEEMQSELEELKNGTTLSKTETVAGVIADFFKSLERLKEVMSMEVEEWEE